MTSCWGLGFLTSQIGYHLSGHNLEPLGGSKEKE